MQGLKIEGSWALVWKLGGSGSWFENGGRWS